MNSFRVIITKSQKFHFLLFLALQGSNLEKMIRFSWEASQIVRLAIHIGKQNDFHYLRCHHIWEITHAGVIYVASIDSHGVQWTCTLFTTLPRLREVKKYLKLFLIWILVLPRTVWHQFCNSLTFFFSKSDPCRAKNSKKMRLLTFLTITRELDVSDMSNYTFSELLCPEEYIR